MNENELILLWDNNKIRITSYIRKSIDRPDIINDIMQEVFIKFWENHEEIKDKNKTLQWLISVSRFTIADYYRKKQLDNIKLKSLIVDDCSEQESTTSTPEESKKILPIIHSLPKKYANIILLSDIHRFPQKMISTQFGLSISCVKKRIERGRKLLALKMKECCAFTHDKYGNIVSCSEKSKYLEIIKDLKMSR